MTRRLLPGTMGSISVVTFMAAAAAAFLTNMHIEYEGYINGLPALMETPAIIVALILAFWAKQKTVNNSSQKDISLAQMAENVILSKSVILLLGAMVVGFLTGLKGMETVKVFGVLAPFVNAFLGIMTGVFAGLSIGGVTLLGALAASSSYIVAPAAMRVSLPKASPVLYLGTSLGVTLPFNLIAGIPLYYHFHLTFHPELLALIFAGFLLFLIWTQFLQQCFLLMFLL